RVGLIAGSGAALALLNAAPKAARRLGAATPFAEWLRVTEQLASLAPESVPLLLDRTEGVLADVDIRAYEAWTLGGVRMAGNDPAGRIKFFSRDDPGTRRRLGHDADAPAFSDLERRLKAYLLALWHLDPPIRSGAGPGREPPRRAGFESGIVRMPESFPGFPPPQMRTLFRAALAHIGAHFRFTREKFPVGSLKPVQLALISLIEDARVEQLAMREFPGLRRLWLPFHVAEASGALAAPILFARLARALIDPDYRDDNAWVRKGRDLFFEQAPNWQDQAISRTIGGLLGNDLGQMRVQFNARTYVVEPPYRDDNLGLWDFGETPPSAEAETVFDTARFEQGEEEPRRERDEPDEPSAGSATRAKPVAPADEDSGVPVAHYPEWDYLIGRDRVDWTTVVEVPAPLGAAATIERILEAHEPLVNRITALIRSAKVSRPVRLRRQPEGERLDLDACIGAAVARRGGDTPDPRVFMTLERRHRDLSALVLLDVSHSTNDIVRGGDTSVLALERAATALVAHAMAGLGDPFALHAFCSNGREDVRYIRIKDFDGPYDGLARRRLAGLQGALSTRIGAAIRHAGVELGRQRSHRRLLLVVTDGEPSDIDIGDRKYLVEDARKAVLTLAHHGIDVFCVGLDAGGDSYLSRIFGRRNVLQIDRLERLPEKLPLLYLRLTA
ncbi:MAG: nitric oxide reductase activation protein NorD, partial [Candidatus Eiseniibacteriota bacterium]